MLQVMIHHDIVHLYDGKSHTLSTLVVQILKDRVDLQFQVAFKLDVVSVIQNKIEGFYVNNIQNKIFNMDFLSFAQYFKNRSSAIGWPKLYVPTARARD